MTLKYCVGISQPLSLRRNSKQDKYICHLAGAEGSSQGSSILLKMSGIYV